MSDDVNIQSNVKNLELYSDNYPFRLSLRIRNFESESEYKKFIKNTEMTIRKSMEYKLWRNYIVDVLQIQTCMITNEKMDETSIDVHHHLPNLYVLISAIVNKKIELEEDFCTFDIAREGIELHFANKIGYLTLLRSIHEKFHNGYLSIPINLVKGNYNSFIQEYSRYIDEEDLDIINQRLSINESNCSWSRNNYLGVINE